MATDREKLEFLEKKLSPGRRDLFKRVISRRTNHFTVAIEDVYQLHNTSAVIRSCDVFGIQNIHIIEEINLKKIDREIAMGSQKWVDVNRYHSSEICMEKLREDGYRIIATSPHKGTALQDFDITGRAAIFFGRETQGISPVVQEEADEFLHVPMVGFTESLNISVSAAIILQELTFRLRRSELEWQLSEDEKMKKRLDWVMKNFKNVEEQLKFFQQQD